MFTYIIKLDNKEQKRFENQKSDFCVLKYILDHQGQSMSYALKYGGWSVDVINEETKDVCKY